jgi:UDP-N-acetylmuramoyl-tripeptide--D-alanyl-D-alanine ligase
VASINPFSRDGWLRAATRPLRQTLAIRQNAKIALAKLNRVSHPATFIAITGSSGKSTTTALLAHVLKGHQPTYRSVFTNSLRGVTQAVFQAPRADKFIVLEVGASTKGSVAQLADIVRPDIAIVTMVGLEHYSVFRSREAVGEEKGHLVAAVRPGGFALLNADDEHVLAMRGRTAERIVTFGRSETADFRVLATDFVFPGPLSVRIAWKGGEETITSPLLGSHFWVSVSASFAAAVELGVPVALIKERIAGFAAIRNRCQIVEMADGPTFILDAAKAPYGTVGLSFDVVASAVGRRKRIVIGQISDYSGTSRRKHRDVYELARNAADEVIGVGENAHKFGASEEEIASGRFRRFLTVHDLYLYLKETAAEGDLILLKSSSSLHLERVVMAWEGGVRCWEDRCGRRDDCVRCGLYGAPFEDHRLARRRARWHSRMGTVGRLFSSSRKPVVDAMRSMGRTSPGAD